MNPTGRILVVDDDALFAGSLCDVLSRDGYEIEAVATADAARERIRSQSWDVVLLDRKLNGALGADSGLDLLSEISAVSPSTRTIVVTAFADNETIARAFKDGAYDYLEKRETLEMLLRVKVRNAIEAIRERRIASLANGNREKVIRELWQNAQREPVPQRKGRLLEDLLALIFKAVPGFEQTQTNRHSVDEEIDLVIRNDSMDPYWLKQGSYLLAECKNWSGAVDRAEFDAFRAKMMRRFGKTGLGFFISVNGFTQGFETARQATRESGQFVVRIEGRGIERLVVESGRNEVLKALCDESVI